MWQAATQFQTIGEVFKDSFKIYKKVLLLGLGWLLLSGVLQILTKMSIPIVPVAHDAAGHLKHLPPRPFSIWALVLVPLNCFVVGCFVAKAWNFVQQRKDSLGKVLLQGLIGNIFFVGAYIILVAILGICLILIFFLFALIPYLGEFIGGALVIILGVYCLIYLFPLYVLSIAGQNPYHAITNSIKLVKGNWWRTFLVLLILTVVIGMIEFVLYAVSGTSVKQIFNHQAAGIGEYVVMFIINLFILPWCLSVTILWVRNLQLRS